MNEKKRELVQLINEGLERYYKAHAKYISGKGGLTLPTEAGCIADVLLEHHIKFPVLCEHCKAFVRNKIADTDRGNCYRDGLEYVQIKKIDDFCSKGEKREEGDSE